MSIRELDACTWCFLLQKNDLEIIDSNQPVIISVGVVMHAAGLQCRPTACITTTVIYNQHASACAMCSAEILKNNIYKQPINSTHHFNMICDVYDSVKALTIIRPTQSNPQRYTTTSFHQFNERWNPIRQITIKLFIINNIRPRKTWKRRCSNNSGANC